MKVFNEQQNQVIRELDRNVLVLASAGTGKTDTLAARIIHILELKRAIPEEILCITFTNKACKEMKERIEQIVGIQSEQITVQTFHGFCFDVIKKEAKNGTDVFTDVLIFDEEDCQEIIQECKKTLRVFQDPMMSTKAIQSFIELAKLSAAEKSAMGDVDYEKIVQQIFHTKEGQINRICTERNSLNVKLKEALRKWGASLVNTYNLLLYMNHGLDFTDLIVATRELFKDPAIAEAYREKYRYIHIDEVQDTSVLEYVIIEKLFAQNNVLMCGDIFQTIYGWRGSEPQKIFTHYKKSYAPREIVFHINYRATKNLAKASMGYLEQAFPDLIGQIYQEKLQIESLKEGQKIIVKRNDHVVDEAKFIVQQMKQLDAETLEKTCILTRDNQYNTHLSEAFRWMKELKNQQFEFVLVDQYRFFRRQEIKDLIGFMKLIINRWDSVSLRRVLRCLAVGVGDATIEKIQSKDYREIGITLADFIDPDTHRTGEPFHTLIKEYKQGNIVIFDVESTGIEPGEDEIIQIAAIRINDQGKVVESFERFIRNTKSVKGSEHIHGFTDQFLQDYGEDKFLVLKDFLKFSAGSVIVGHNVQFDVSILRAQLDQCNLPSPDFLAIYDTLDIYRRFHPSLINHKLETLSEVFSTKTKPSHNAMDDILATSQLLVRVLEQEIIPSTLIRIQHISKHLGSFEQISKDLGKFFVDSQVLRPHELVKDIILRFGLKEKYGRDRMDYVYRFYFLLEELNQPSKSNYVALLDTLKMTSLSNGDLEQLLLKGKRKIKIPIITVHQAKGLEFNTVFLAGMQENTFPSYRAIKSKELEEEQRTFYVALTRAKEQLYITYSVEGRYGKMNNPSRFIELIPRECLKER